MNNTITFNLDGVHNRVFRDWAQDGKSAVTNLKAHALQHGAAGAWRANGSLLLVYKDFDGSIRRKTFKRAVGRVPPKNVSANGKPETDVGRVHGLSWVTVKDMFSGLPQPLIHDTGDRVWVGCDYSEDLPDGVVQVGDGLNNGYDVQGNKIISVPVEWCTFISEEEAESILQCRDADEQLLNYAR